MTDPSGFPILADASPKKPADPFDFGGGIINPIGATNPGLIFDMEESDYIHYLCSVYSNPAIAHLTGHQTICPSKKPSILNLNQPSITIPHLSNITTITRTVTNVGALRSNYIAIVEAPVGIKISVKPSSLMFKSLGQRLSFKVVVSSVHKINTGFMFGSLKWVNRKNIVRIPLTVRVEDLNSFDASQVKDEF